MSELMRVLRENPETMKEYKAQMKLMERMVEVATKYELEYRDKLEELIENGGSREEMLRLMDEHYKLTEQMDMEVDEETWWEMVMDKIESVKNSKN